MKLYSGIDLHSTNSYLAIIDESGKRIFKEKLPNDIATISETLSLYSGALEGVVVESTYNWYWLVDGLMADGHTVHLANPSAIQKYTGLKHADDKHDAFWLAEMLRLNILPEGYIYPKEERPIRDLLRKRESPCGIAVVAAYQPAEHHHTELRHEDENKRYQAPSRKPSHPLLADNEDLALAGQVSKDSPIDQSSRPLANIALGAAALARGYSLVWFPEGGRSSDGKVQPFQSGIGMMMTAHPTPLIPVWIEGSFEALPTGARWPHRRVIRVVFGEALEAGRLAGPSRGADRFRRIATALHDHVAALGGRPVQPSHVSCEAYLAKEKS